MSFGTEEEEEEEESGLDAQSVWSEPVAQRIRARSFDQHKTACENGQMQIWIKKLRNHHSVNTELTEK